MTEEWTTIADFPNYLVSDQGRIMNEATGDIIKKSRNQQGLTKINLGKNGVFYTRLVSHLVAAAYLERPENREDFNSVIHLNGDKSDCRAENLMWRPRYFTFLYHKQFDSFNFKEARLPVLELKSGITYPNAREAAMINGLLVNDILISSHERTYTWPTFQQFRMIMPD